MEELFHVKINDEIWEINIPAKKALQRSLRTVNPDQAPTVPVDTIIDYITKHLGYPHYKQTRITKYIFSKSPICTYRLARPRSDNPDAVLMCEKSGVTQDPYRGWRCAEHKNS